MTEDEKAYQAEFLKWQSDEQARKYFDNLVKKAIEARIKEIVETYLSVTLEVKSGQPPRK